MSTSGDSGIRRRLHRLRENRIRGGLLTVEEAAALASVGFEPVSEVIGAVASTVTPSGFYRSYPGFFPPTTPFQRQKYYNQPHVPAPVRTYTSSSSNVSVGVPQSITALKAGYRTALNRLNAEAGAAGADGVVGIRVERTISHSGGTQLWSFVAVGTAVRSTGHTHTANPFTTSMSAAGVAAAVRGGWVPVSLVIAPVMAIRWIDPASRIQSSMTQIRGLAVNVEVDAYTDVVNTCRHQARQDFAAAARQVHADGAVLSDMTLEFEADRKESFCTASVTVTGTAMARLIVRHHPPAPLTIIPLTGGLS